MAIDYASQIAAELKKDKVDWNKLSQLAGATGGKIGASGQSTESYINQLYAQRTPTNTVKPNTNVSSPSPSNANSYSPSSSPNSYSPSPTYAKNPYAFMNGKAVQTAYINPITGEVSIVGGQGESVNSNRYMSHDQYISKGYTPVTDSSTISQLQQGALDTSTFKDTSQWQNWLNQNAGLVQPLSQSDIDAANQRLTQYNAYLSGANSNPSLVGYSNQEYGNGLTYPVVGGGNLTDLVRDQYRYNNEANINALRQAYMQSKGELQGQIPGIQQAARSAYDANDAYYYTQALPELRAAMEQAGLYRGGDMLGGNVNLLTMRGQNAGQISQDQMNQVNAIQQAIAQLNAEEPLKIAEMGAANNAAEAQALLDAINTGIQNNIAVAGVTGEYGGKLTPAGQLTQQEILKNKAATIAAANYDNIAGYINTLDPNDPLIPYLNAERQGKIQKQAEEQAARAAAASAAEKARYEQAFEMWKTYGVATAEIASILGVPVGARTADFNIDSINAATSQQNANTAANKTQSNVNLASYINYIESNFGNNKTNIRAYLESLYTQGVDESVINALADKYGIR